MGEEHDANDATSIAFDGMNSLEAVFRRRAPAGGERRTSARSRDGIYVSGIEVTTMFRIEPETLYSRHDLERELEGLMDLETFLLRIRPRKRYKSAWWGQDLIDALNGLSREDPVPRRGSKIPRHRRPLTRSEARSRPAGLEPIGLSEERERCP